jgi:colanic acid/amylovoran biosynthesis glycosyltransferase
MPEGLAYVLKRFPRISETFIAAELLELERQGESPVVFAVARPAEPFRHAFLDGLRAPVVYLPRRPSREPLRVGLATWRALRRRPRGFARAARFSLVPPRRAGLRRLLQAAVLEDEMERRGIRHAHAHFATAAARIANLAWRMGGPGYSVTTHAKDIYHREIRPAHLRDKLRPARFVVAITDANRRHLRAVLGGECRLELVPNSVDLRRLGPPRRGPPAPGKVIAIARLVEKKGLIDLIEACGGLDRQGAWLEVVGEGPLRGELERAAADQGARARFLGVLPQEQALLRLRTAAVFCLPCIEGRDGDRDGLPTSLLEAMAVGVPVVTTSLGGIGEAVIHERTGLVVAPHDPAGVAAAIDRLLGDPGLGRALAAEARRHVERRFALEASVARLRSLFREAV